MRHPVKSSATPFSCRRNGLFLCPVFEGSCFLCEEVWEEVTTQMGFGSQWYQNAMGIIAFLHESGHHHHHHHHHQRSKQHLVPKIWRHLRIVSICISSHTFRRTWVMPSSSWWHLVNLSWRPLPKQ